MMQQLKKEKISIILPIHNESKNIPLIYQQINTTFQKKLTNYSFEIIFIDDGSTDNSLKEIKKITKDNKNVKALSFSRNFGHQIALSAGMDFASGKAIISMDSDLQHPVSIIPKMIAHWKQGFDLVLTIRIDNKNIPFLKRKITSFFYKLVNLLSETKIYQNAADYRLISRLALNQLNQMKEKDRFLRGMVSWVGFKTKFIKYNVQKRIYGESSYSLISLIKFSINALTSFSAIPLRISFFIGALIAIFSTVYSLIIVLQVLLFNKQFPEGWTSILFGVLFLGGIQLMSLGIIGEYIYRIYNETKNRPLYIIAKKINFEK